MRSKLDPFVRRDNSIQSGWRNVLRLAQFWFTQVFPCLSQSIPFHWSLFEGYKIIPSTDKGPRSILSIVGLRYVWRREWSFHAAFSVRLKLMWLLLDDFIPHWHRVCRQRARSPLSLSKKSLNDSLYRRRFYLFPMSWLINQIHSAITEW